MFVILQKHNTPNGLVGALEVVLVVKAARPIAAAVSQRLSIAHVERVLAVEIHRASLIHVVESDVEIAGRVEEVGAVELWHEVVAQIGVYGCAGHDNHVVAEGGGEAIAEVVLRVTEVG